MTGTPSVDPLNKLQNFIFRSVRHSVCSALKLPQNITAKPAQAAVEVVKTADAAAGKYSDYRQPEVTNTIQQLDPYR